MRVPRVGPVTYPPVNTVRLTRGACGEKRARLASVFFFLVLLPHGTKKAGATEAGEERRGGRPAPAIPGQGETTGGRGSAGRSGERQ